MTQAQEVQELEIGPQFISLGSSTIQTRNIASIAIFPDPKEVKTQAEWDRRKNQQAEADLVRVDAEKTRIKAQQAAAKADLLTQKKKLEKEISVFEKKADEVHERFNIDKESLENKIIWAYRTRNIIFMISATPIILWLYVVVFQGAQLLPGLFGAAFWALVIFIIIFFTVFEKHIEYQGLERVKGRVSKIESAISAIGSSMRTELLHIQNQSVDTKNRLSEVDKVINQIDKYLKDINVTLSSQNVFSIPFQLTLTTNSGTAFSIPCASLEYAFDLKRRFDAALGGTDIAIYHVDSRTQNIQMVVNANIKIEINNDIDQIMSRLEQLRAEDRAELKAYLDEVRLVANRNAISKDEAQETQTKLDKFLDKYRKIVGAANDTVNLVNNIKKVFNPFL